MIRFLCSAALTLSAILTAQAQNIGLCHQVIGSTGQSTTESGLHYSYTVGEVAIFTLKKDGVNVVLTQGFHQPDVCLPVSTHEEEEWSAWDIQAYPNPVTDQMTLLYSAPDNTPLVGKVVNLMGQTVLDFPNVAAGGHTLPCGTLQAGYYVLVLSHPEKATTVAIPFSKIF